MARELSVRLNGIEVGTLSLVNGKMEFLYSDSCEYPISLSLPLSKEPYKEKICRAYSKNYFKLVILSIDNLVRCNLQLSYLHRPIV